MPREAGYSPLLAGHDSSRPGAMWVLRARLPRPFWTLHDRNGSGATWGFTGEVYLALVGRCMTALVQGRRTRRPQIQQTYTSPVDPIPSTCVQ